MKIALINLPVDNNYGGMLQRYALMKVLETMGHEVVHLNLRFPINNGTLIQKMRRTFRRVSGRICGNYKGAIMAEYRAKKLYDESCRVTDEFYDKFIRHTPHITNKVQLAKLCEGADVLIIGSDQVWRKEYEGQYGIGTYFGDFLPKSSTARKIVYGASFGVAEDMLSIYDKEYLMPFYQSFYSVSVREDSALRLLNNYGWTHPQAKLVLDPTLLLSKEDYSQLIDTADTRPLDGKMLCYILDQSEEKNKTISELSTQHNMKTVYLSINGIITIEQWLRAFRDAEYIVTDSYHGLLFSIIMEKPFYLFKNKKRGDARFDSILNLCGIYNYVENINWDSIRERVDVVRKKSLAFLGQSLSM